MSSPSEFQREKLCFQTTANKLPGYNAKHTSSWTRQTVYSHTGCLVSLELTKVTEFLFTCTHTETSIIKEMRNGLYLNVCWDLKESLLHSLLSFSVSLPLSCMAGLTGWQSWERQVGFVFLGTTPPPLREKKMQDCLGKVHRKSHPFSTLELTRNMLHLGAQQFSHFFSQKGSRSTLQ